MSRKKELATIIVAVKLPASLDRNIEILAARAGFTKRALFEMALNNLMADWGSEWMDKPRKSGGGVNA